MTVLHPRRHPFPLVSSLRFYCIEREALVDIRQDGLHVDGRGGELIGDFDEALDRCHECLLVLDVDPSTRGNGRIAPDAIRNLDPYLPPAPVTAAGGYVTRRRPDRLEVLLIHRRGLWDLPKGKLDPDETIEECALREVREELGVADVELGQPLGATVHGYPERGKYRVKTTHWFEMTTTADQFFPEAEEDISAAEWVPWEQAVERIGHETLRRHMRRIEPLLITENP